MELVNHKVVHKQWRPSSKAKRFWGILSKRPVPTTREEFNEGVRSYSSENIAKARESFKMTLKASRWKHRLVDELEQKPAGRRLSNAQVRGILSTFTKEQIRQAKRRLWNRG